ncbi:MAG: methyltransferase domain-containing protein [Pseudomonadota bacterium]
MADTNTSLSRDAEKQPQVAVLIATRNRPELLATRALSSVAEQDRLPDVLVVVDDSDPGYREQNKACVDDLRLPEVEVVLVQNTRTRGASGAWNSGLVHLSRTQEPSRLFVAVLDDDDAWRSGYLRRCLAAAAEGDHHMVAADLLRIEAPGARGLPGRAPERLDPHDFLVGNPNIQGSNLFVRLDMLLAAGMFDEGLRSSTDRDLCLRLSDLPELRYRRVPALLVEHHAEAMRPRLSSPGSTDKLEGLSAFWRKYRGRMTQAERGAFVARARRLFGWHPGLPLAADMAGLDADAVNPQALVVALIADVRGPGRFQLLLDDLVQLASDRRLAGLDVVLLENGHAAPDAPNPLDLASRRLWAADIGCFVATMADQQRHAQQGLFGPPFERPEGMASIASARGMLQVYAWLVARERKGAVVWILDGDSRLVPHCLGPGGTPEHCTANPLEIVQGLRAAGVDIAIGTVTGSPPLPFTSCIRTQLVDALHNLAWMARLDPESPFPDRGAENMAARARARDYYYDLSRDSLDHLESPFWWIPPHPGATVREAFQAMVTRLPRMLAGEQIFRPLIQEAGLDPVSAMAPSIQRGGNTLVLDPDALWAFPNPAVRCNGVDSRRSDTIWCLFQQRLAGRRIFGLPFAVHQDRGLEEVQHLDLEKLASDMLGHALALALSEQLGAAPDGHEGVVPTAPEALAAIDIPQIHASLLSFHAQRRDAFLSSCHRIRGLVRSLRAYSAEGGATAWWRGMEGCEMTLAALRAFLAALDEEYHRDRIDAFNAHLHLPDEEALSTFVADQIAVISHRAVGPPPAAPSRAWMERERVASGTAWITREYGTGPLRVLGTGAEAVVYTDGRTVFKCLDYWKSRLPSQKLRLLRSLVGAWSGLPGLVDIQEVRARGSWVMLRYPYTPTEPYRGGHGLGLLRLLRSCREAGIVCNNIHPDNLRVQGDEVLLIDYGADIHPYSDDGFEHMVRRTWLTHGRTNRPDLKALMSRALTDHALPELEGWRLLLQAVGQGSKEHVLDDHLVARFGPGHGRRALDYGCGKGKLAEALAHHGWEVTGYDPNPALAVRWEQGFGEIRLLGAGGAAQLIEEGALFDLVTSNLVLCILDDRERARVLSDLTRLLAPGGRLVVSLCNPRFVHGTTALQRRHPPAGVSSADRFTLEKTVFSTGRTLVDQHRPLEEHLAAFTAAGLTLLDTWESPGLDLDTFQPTSDFLVLELTPSSPERRQP